MKLPADSDELVRFDAAVLMRGINAVKSTRLLLEQAHWEFAAGPVRQLFELLVNMEYVAAHANRDRAAFRYAKYGLLQTVLSQRAAMDYARDTGRPVDQARVAALDTMLERTFPEFRRVTKRGNVAWARSWSGKGTRALAAASPNPLRVAQYQQLFVVWSEQVHGAPATMLSGIFPLGAEGGVDEIVAHDDKEIAETAAMAVSLFAELWTTLRNVPALDPRTMGEWMAALMRQARAFGA